MLAGSFRRFFCAIYFSVRYIVVEFIAFKWSAFGNELIPLACLFKRLSRTYLAEHLESGFVGARDKALAFLDFYKITEVPGELLGEIKIVLDVLNIDVLVVEHVVEDPFIHEAHVPSDLLVLICTVLEFYSLVESCL